MNDMAEGLSDDDLQELAAMSTDANTFAGLDDAALDVLGNRDASPVAARLN